jgi:hypothetical protein
MQVLNGSDFAFLKRKIWVNRIKFLLYLNAKSGINIEGIEDYNTLVHERLYERITFHAAFF